jgi:hypothetical protein
LRHIDKPGSRHPSLEAPGRGTAVHMSLHKTNDEKERRLPPPAFDDRPNPEEPVGRSAPASKPSIGRTPWAAAKSASTAEAAYGDAARTRQLLFSVTFAFSSDAAGNPPGRRRHATSAKFQPAAI